MEVLSWEAGACLLALCHIWYAFLWFFPWTWCGLCKTTGTDPCYSMFVVALFVKVQQFATVGWFVVSHNTDDPLSDILGTNGGVLRVAIAAVLFFVGQLYNFGSTRALGVDGIYYGFRYGKTIPWYTGWPYGGTFRLPHPQYAGAIMSIAGAALLLATPSLLTAGVHYMLLAWAVCYVLNGVMEEYVHQVDWATKRKH